MDEGREIIVVKVTENDKIILNWFGIEVTRQETFARLLEGLVIASNRDVNRHRFSRPIDMKDSTTVQVRVRQTEKSEGVEANPSLSVFQFCQKFGSFVHFNVKQKQTTDQSCTRNAFDVLLESARKIDKKYPSKFGSDESVRGDWRLRNDFIDLMERKGAGFTDGQEESVGKTFVNNVTSVLFSLMPHLSKLQSRGFKLPDLFNVFFQNKDTFQQNYNNPSGHKHFPRLKVQELEHKRQLLYTVMVYPFLKLPRFKEFDEAVKLLCNGIDIYIKNLEETTERVNTIHQQPFPQREPADGKSTDLKHIKGKIRDNHTVVQYKKVEVCLLEKAMYEPVSLNEIMPVDRRLRYRYVHNLVLPFDIELYGYHSGSQYGSLWFVWKSMPLTDMEKSNKVIHEIGKNLPVYHTRAMKREFMSRFSLVVKVSPTILNEMYYFLTGDHSVPSHEISKSVRERLKVILDGNDPDIAVDMRKINEGRPSVFDRFWAEVDKLLEEEASQAVDDRRHGTVCFTSTAMSVPDLLQKVTRRLPSEVPIPSEKWLYLQFMPKNPFLRSAIQYTGKFPLKFKVQSRQFNMTHQDAHYASAIFKYLKEFCVKFRDHTVLLCVDDKNQIPVGEPGVPLAAVGRGKQTVVQSEIPLVASDHDMNTKCKITPSTIILTDIPDSVDESFYRGQVVEILKDTIFEPSSPLRHAAEMRKAVSTEGKLDLPIRAIYSDGGSDHRVSYPSVQISLIGLFLLDDLDFLVAARCAPHQSYTNPPERWHAVMNLALQSVAIQRSAMAEHFEKALSSAVTMKQIRLLGDRRPQLKDALMESLGSVIGQLNELLGRLKLKGVPCKVGQPANETLIDEVWQAVLKVDNTLQLDQLTTKDIRSKPALNKFMEHCTTSRKYFFTIQKCGKDNCDICKPPRLPKDVFRLLCPLPDPVPTPDGEHYKSFSELYGTETSEKYCPSIANGRKQTLPAEREVGFRLSGETVRHKVDCCECQKPRLIYSKKKLTNDEMVELDILKENCDYSCGSCLIPPDHSLKEVLAEEREQ
ncbi:uncharacterized protein [Ptychodera flava]|uniref:uncharacterized protein isoform X2 n=1 Tax=Ptychodera flava TaxID=63121 RepID=UPI00396A33CC